MQEEIERALARAARHIFEACKRSMSKFARGKQSNTCGMHRLATSFLQHTHVRLMKEDQDGGFAATSSDELGLARSTAFDTPYYKSID